MSRFRLATTTLGLALAVLLQPEVARASQAETAAATAAVARHSFDAVNEALATGANDAIDAVFAVDFANRTPDRSSAAAEPYPSTLAGFNASLANLRRSFPDARYTVDDVVAEGDRAAVRFTFVGTPDAAAFGLTPPVTRPVTFGGIALLRVADGRIAESWYYVDQSAVPAQIAALQELPPAGTPAP